MERQGRPIIHAILRSPIPFPGIPLHAPAILILVTPVFRRDVLPVIQWYDLVTIHLVWPITFPCCQSASFRALHRLQTITVPLMAFSAKRRYRDG